MVMGSKVQFNKIKMSWNVTKHIIKVCITFHYNGDLIALQHETDLNGALSQHTRTHADKHTQVNQNNII